MKPYDDELAKFIENNRMKYYVGEMCALIYMKFNKKITRKALAKYYYRHNLDFKKKNTSYKCLLTKPIGTESNPDKNGLVRVKINEKQWAYKQRLIYEQYYNIKLPKDYIVVFLDNNKMNYDIDNLMAVPKKVALRTAGQDMFYKNKELTKASLLISAIRLKAMESEKANDR